MHLYSVAGYEGDIKPSCDEGRLEWIDIQDVFDLPMWEGDKYFLQPLLAGKEKINMVLRYEGTSEEERLVEVTAV